MHVYPVHVFSLPPRLAVLALHLTLFTSTATCKFAVLVSSAVASLASHFSLKPLEPLPPPCPHLSDVSNSLQVRTQFGHPSNRLDDTNVQRGSLNPDHWDTLCNTHEMAKGWRTTLDSGQWMSYSASNTQHWVFRKKFIGQHPMAVVLRPDGWLEVVDRSGGVIWKRGPSGVGGQWKLTAEENGDAALRNDKGVCIWSAIADPTMHENL